MRIKAFLLIQYGNLSLTNITKFYKRCRSCNFNNSGTVDILTGKFESNKATAEHGGVIYNFSGRVNNINAVFSHNVANTDGGAIYNYANGGSSIIGNIEGTFEYNKAGDSGDPGYGNGGAIANYNDGETAQINRINATFNNNEAYNKGGAIYNDAEATISSIEQSVFKSNKAEHGGAIYNEGTISNIVGDFILNTATTNGGAINNNGSSSKITNITGNFSHNSANGAGGAIYNLSSGEISNIAGDFESNSATTGGAICNFNGSAKIGNIAGNFKGNHADGSSNSNGGAIYNSGIIENIIGDFENNSATKWGGAIVNGKTINKVTGNFTNNSAKSGGVVYNAGTINFVAENGKNITFSGNYVTDESGNGGAIFNATSGTVGLYASADHSITFTGDTTGLPNTANNVDSIHNLKILNINGDDENDTTYTGTVNLNTVSDADTARGTTNIYGGTVSVAKDLTQKAVTVASGATLTTNGNVTTTNGVTNAGTLNLLNGTSETSATIDSAISGAGTTNINGGVVNITKDITQNAINVKSGAELNSTGNIKVTETLTNNGNVSIYGITGEIQNNAGGSLTFNDTTEIVDINLTNSGTVNFNGPLNVPDFGFILTQNAGTMNFSTTAIETTAEYGKINTFTMNGGLVNIADGNVNTLHINQLNLAGNTNFAMDADLTGEEMDKIQIHDTDNSEITVGKVININKINLLSDATQEKISLSIFADEDTKNALINNVHANINGLQYSPTYTYDANYNQTEGEITFTRHNSGGSDDYNPYLYAPSSIAQTIASITGQIAGLAMDKLDAAVTNSEKGLAAGDMPKASNAWVKVMGFDDDVDFKHFNSIDSKAYTLAAGFNTDKVKFDNFDAAFGLYGGYIGGRQKYTGNKIEQEGGYVGLSSELKKGNAFLLSTVNSGFINNEAENMYGTDKFDTRWLGVGLKGGYNYALTDTWTLQPNVYAGYTFANTEDYTSKSGVKVKTDNLHFFEIDPGFKLSKQIDKGGIGYIQGKYAIVMDNGGDTKATDIALPDISHKNYFEYGFGMNKSLTDAWSLNGEINRRDGGRSGWNGSVEFKYNF